MEMTTIKVDKKTVGKLHGVKGHLDYLYPSKKHTLDDTLNFLTDDYYKRNK